MSIDAIRAVVARLGSSAGALAAIGIALHALESGTSLDPQIQVQLDDVLDALGARDVILDADPARLGPVLAGIRGDFFLAAKLLSGKPGQRGWAHAETEILQAFGDVSAGFPAFLRSAIAPRLDGLLARLEAPEASFLDVGVGVAALSVEMARQWPSLHVVGIDPWPASLMIARENVRKAGFTTRIALREQAGENLSDIDEFDLAWVAGAFIPEPEISKVIERVRRALRPGGWLLLAMASPGDDPLAAALARFRAALWGGSLLSASGDAEDVLTRSGLVAVRMLPGLPHSPIAIAVGRKSLE